MRELIILTVGAIIGYALARDGDIRVSDPPTESEVQRVVSEAIQTSNSYNREQHGK